MDQYAKMSNTLTSNVDQVLGRLLKEANILKEHMEGNFHSALSKMVSRELHGDTATEEELQEVSPLMVAPDVPEDSEEFDAGLSQNGGMDDTDDMNRMKMERFWFGP